MKQLDVYMRDLKVSDTVVIRDNNKNGEDEWDDLMAESPDVDSLIDMVSLYQ